MNVGPAPLVAERPTVATWRRLVWPVVLAVLCVAVLGTRSYVDFDRVRVRFVTQPRPADAVSMTVPLGPQPRLHARPVAIILAVYGDAGGEVSVALDGSHIGTVRVPGNREARIDLAVDRFPSDARTLTVTSTQPGWTLTYLELSTAHGYSGGLFEVVFAPAAARGTHVPLRYLLLLLIALLIYRPDPAWPQGWLRYVYRPLAAAVVLVFAVALVSPWLSRFSVLLSLTAFGGGLLILYAEPLVRAVRSVRRVVLDLRARDLESMPGCREVRRATADGIPWWVTALDVLGLVVLGLMLRSMLDDGYRLTLAPEFRISLRSWLRIGAWLAILLLVRHLLWRGVAWHSRVSCWIWSAIRWAPARAVWPSYVVSRLLALSVGYVAVHTIGFPNDHQPFRALESDVLDLFARWDAGWYFWIASYGYGSDFNPTRQSPIAFFPALPIAMRITGAVLDSNLWVAGIIVVLLAFFAGLTYVYRLALDEGLTPDQARTAVVLLAFYPFAVCYSVVLTEALFLLAAAAAFFHFRRGELWKAGLFGLATGLLRPNGFLLALPLGLIAMLPFARQRGWLPWAERGPGLDVTTGRLAIQLAIAALPVVGMLLHAAHLYTVTGNPFAFVEVQQAWGRRPFELLNVIEGRWDLIVTRGVAVYAQQYATEILDGAAAVLALVAVWPIVRRFGIAYGVFVVMTVVPPLLSLGTLSLGRFTAPLFPIFLWLGASIPPERRPYWLAVFAGGQALIAALFYTWRPPF
jgi:hypothetical protein